MGTSVLIVDDESIVRDVLTRYLERDGFSVHSAANGEEAIDRYQISTPDLVLLDVMLPRFDGIEVLRFIRSEGSTPVIVLTAKGAETDRIAGLELGADDYIVKPFSPGEVMARVRAVLRRAPSTSDNASAGEALAYPDLSIDPRSREAKRGGELLELTPKEFALLYFLASHSRRVFSRLELLAELWDFAFEGDPNTVTVHIRRLREKIEDDPSHPRRIVTVWGTGYRFDP